MVGGGEGAFIGAVHRSAARLDGDLELVCGAFSSDAERSRRAGASLHLDPERCYADYREMFASEAKRRIAAGGRSHEEGEIAAGGRSHEEGEIAAGGRSHKEGEIAAGGRSHKEVRSHNDGTGPQDDGMDFVVIVTPNHLHFPVAVAALESGFHVLSDKPATVSLAECRKLGDEIKKSGLLYGLTHPYTSYPLIVEARQRVAAGQLGTIRKVIVEYTQGWLADAVERTGNAQAKWRLDPAKAGPSGCFGDIGVHAFNLVEFVTGLRVTELSADLNRIVEGRVLDDDGVALLRFDNEASGVLVASQICTGDENNFRLRVYGEGASLEWNQQEPNSLWLKHAHRATELLRSGAGHLGTPARYHSRLPAGHPEGYIEAFANLYRVFGEQVRAHASGSTHAVADAKVPGIEAALRGMAFIETVVAASAATQKWHVFPDVGQ
jgi:predicted dehydrogenase